MSDYNSSLPVRSQADADERLQSKLVDYTTPSQGMVIDAQGNAHVEVHGDNPAGSDEILRLSELGAVVPDGVYHATNNSDPGNVGLVAHARATTPADTDQTKRITAVSVSSTHSMDVAIHHSDGNDITDAAPLAVYVAADPGTEVVNYNTASAVAANATSNHSYAVSSGSFELHQVVASASGKAKIEVQWTTDGSTFTTLFVLFNSTANPNMVSTLAKPYVLAGSGTSSIRVIRTNKDNQAQDLYSTIVGILK